MKLSRDKGQANQRRATDAEAPAEAGRAEIDPAAHGLREGLPGLRDLMDRLLADDGCPWDRAQTLDTLRPYLVEETHEVLEAMDDPAAHRGELGDLLFQIVFQAAIRERQGQFDLDDVITGIRDKLLRRHPHVFGDQRGEVHTLEDVERQWAAIKAREREGTADARPGPMRRVPKGLPALARAAALQKAAAGLGFDWPDVEGAVAKAREEWDELTEARDRGDPIAIREELGDLLFVLVRLAQKLDVDPDDALRRANTKFERRFESVLERCHDAGVDPAAAGLDVLDAIWNEIKADERAKSGGR